MNRPPFVPAHIPQFSYLFFHCTSASAKTAAITATAGRQNELHNKAGESQTQKVNEADYINDKIHRPAFYHFSANKITQFIAVSFSRRRHGDCVL